MESQSLFICNMDRTDELNQRILARNIPSGDLDILIESRPQPTKYVHLQTVDNNQCMVSEKKEAYNITQTFNPGTGNGPWTGFMNKIDDESVLRNQMTPLQNNDHLVYIPKDTSDLYRNTMPYLASVDSQFIHLFEKPVVSNTSNENLESNINLATNIFNNDTRQQLKDS